MCIFVARYSEPQSRSACGGAAFHDHPSTRLRDPEGSVLDTRRAALALQRQIAQPTQRWGRRTGEGQERFAKCLWTARWPM